MRADRLLSILLLLQTRGRMTAHELAEQLEVSERTIYRDMEALSIAGIPVYAERGPGGGCTLVDGYQTRLTGLTETEVRALFLVQRASPLVELGLNESFAGALLKLSASLPTAQRDDAEQVRQRIHLDNETATDAELRCQLHTIQAAIWQEHRLLLSYQEVYHSGREQCVEPYGLVSKANVWHLVGTVAGEYTVFQVSHLATVKLTTEAFSREASFDLPRYWSSYCEQLRMDAACSQVQQVHQVHKTHNRRPYRQHQPQAKKTNFPAHSQPQQKKVILISTPSARSSQSKEKNRLLHAQPLASPQPLKKTKFPLFMHLDTLMPCA